MDTLDATDGDAGPGADIVEGGPGDDIITGDPADGVWFASASAGGTIDLAAGTATTGDGVDVIVAIANAFGTAFDDTLIGTAMPNVLSGLGGNDTLLGGDSQDELYGGDGDDAITGQGGEDRLFGEAGNDRLEAFFDSGFTVEARGGPGDDLYVLTFGSGSGTIEVIEEDGGGNDEIEVSCTPGMVTHSTFGPGAGTISRAGETVTYTGVETVTIPPSCLESAASPPPSAPGQGPPGGAGPTQPGGAGTTTAPPAPLVTELGAVIVAAARTARSVDYTARASFLALAEQEADPRAFGWRIRRARALVLRDTPDVRLRGKGLRYSRIRARLTVDGAVLRLGARADLPRGARRLLVVSVPAATLASPALREIAVRRARTVSRDRRVRMLTRALRTANRLAELLASEETSIAARIRVTAPRSNRWVKRLERLSAARLHAAVGGKRILLARGAALTLRHAQAPTRVTIVLVRR